MRGGLVLLSARVRGWPGIPTGLSKERWLLLQPIQRAKGLQAYTHDSVLLTVAIRRDV